VRVREYAASVAGSARADVLARVAVAATVATSGLLYATLAPSPDQWFLGYTGWRVTRGDVPYAGFADGNWPAAHWLHALSVALLGTTPYTWRVFDFGLMLACVGFAAATVRSLWGIQAGRWMMGLYPALYVVLGRWFAGERDVVGGHLLFVALWFYWNGLTRGRAAWQLGTGVLLGLAALVKPTFAIFGPLLAVHALLAVRRDVAPLRARVAHVAVAGAGSAATLGAGFLALVLEGSDLREFWRLAVESVVVRYGNDTVSASETLHVFVRNVFASWHWITGGALASLVVHLLRREQASAARNLLFPVLWVTGLASYLLQGQSLGYTLGVLFAATVPILCSGLGLVSFSPGASRGRVVMLAAVVAIPVLGTAKKWSAEFPSSVAWLAGRRTAAAHYATFGAGDGLTAADAIALAEELRREVPPDRTVLVWGRANAVNFLAQRAQPTRFHHNVTIMRRYLPARLSAVWNPWFEQEVTTRAPAVCLVNESELDDLPPAPRSVTFLKRYLAEHYRRVRTIGDSGLYVRR
jgi:hypothetical protein